MASYLVKQAQVSIGAALSRSFVDLLILSTNISIHPNDYPFIYRLHPRTYPIISIIYA